MKSIYQNDEVMAIFYVQRCPNISIDKRGERCIIKAHFNQGGFKIMGRSKFMGQRRNFYLTDMQYKRLMSMSKKMGLTASEILRRAIDEYWERFVKKQRTN
jgi:hypothetical protein